MCSHRVPGAHLRLCTQEHPAYFKHQSIIQYTLEWRAQGVSLPNPTQPARIAKYSQVLEFGGIISQKARLTKEFHCNSTYLDGIDSKRVLGSTTTKLASLSRLVHPYHR